MPSLLTEAGEPIGYASIGIDDITTGEPTAGAFRTAGIPTSGPYDGEGMLVDVAGDVWRVFDARRLHIGKVRPDTLREARDLAAGVESRPLKEAPHPGCFDCDMTWGTTQFRDRTGTWQILKTRRAGGSVASYRAGRDVDALEEWIQAISQRTTAALRERNFRLGLYDWSGTRLHVVDAAVHEAGPIGDAAAKERDAKKRR